MKKTLIYISVLASALLGCDDDIATVSLGIDDYYRVARMQKLDLHPALTGNAYRWCVDGVEVSTDRDYVFMQPDEGEYAVSFDIIDAESPFHFDFVVSVVHEELEYSPYVARVYEYRANMIFLYMAMPSTSSPSPIRRADRLSRASYG